MQCATNGVMSLKYIAKCQSNKTNTFKHCKTFSTVASQQPRLDLTWPRSILTWLTFSDDVTSFHEVTSSSWRPDLIARGINQTVAKIWRWRVTLHVRTGLGVCPLVSLQILFLSRVSRGWLNVCVCSCIQWKPYQSPIIHICLCPKS